jgi:predicted permease
MFRKLELCWRNLLRGNDIGEELQLHLEQLTAEMIGQGLSPQEAASAARRRFGNVTRIHEQSHELFSFRPLEDLVGDMRYGWRSMRRNPSVTVAAVLSIGLAIGVNTVIFSLIEEMFFAKPTSRVAQDLVTIHLGGSTHASLANLRDLNASGGFQQVGGFDVETTVNWRTDDGVRQTPVMLVSENYFELLETRPALGRIFRSDEARAERNPHVVLITDRLWRRKFARDLEVPGRSMVLNGRPYTILGVLPERFRPPTYLSTLPDLYVPASPELNPSLMDPRSHSLMLIARRKRGQTLEQAQAALQVAVTRMATDNPIVNGELRRGIRIFPATGYRQYVDPDEAPLVAFAGLLLVAVFVVLWIACVNVAGVLIARAAARRREIATRMAMGASRGRLVRQLMGEALLLASLGTLVGMSLHWCLSTILDNLSLPLPVPIVFQMATDFTLVMYSIALTAIATVLAGLAPALQATKPGLTSGLKMEEPQYGYRRFTFRNLLMVAQVAVTVVLLSISLLFTRSLMRANSIHPGFDLQHTVWARVNVLSDRYSKNQAYLFASRVLDAAAAVPGVRSAALSDAVPFNSFLRTSSSIHTRASASKIEYYASSVSPSYFETMGIPIFAGRPFSAGDRRGAPNVVVLNEAMARRLFGAGSAVGEKIWFGDRKEGPGVEVIGVTANSKHLTMGENQAFAVYHAIAQVRPDGTEINVFARASGDAESTAGALRKALSPLDITAAIDVGPLRSKLAFAYLPSQIGAVLVGSLGALGLILAVIGIYGATAFAVSRRAAEIGIRIALGASTGQVLRNLLGTSLVMMCTGLAIGIGLALAAAQPLAFLFAEGIKPLDPVTFALVILICLFAGGIASVIPARRALWIDPITALRVE